MVLGWLAARIGLNKTGLGVFEPALRSLALRSLALRSLALGSLALGSLAPSGVAGAADLYEPPPPPPAQYYPPTPPAVVPVVPYGPPVVQAPVEGCRVIMRRGFDPYGREVFRRVRICEEDEVAVAPGYPAPPPPRYGYSPGYYQPQPYGWR